MGFRNANPFSEIYEVKDRMLGVRLNNRSKAYLFNSVGQQAAINDEVGGEAIVVAWDRDSQLAIPYYREVGGQLLSFDLDEDGDFPIGLVDREAAVEFVDEFGFGLPVAIKKPATPDWFGRRAGRPGSDRCGNWCIRRGIRSDRDQSAESAYRQSPIARRNRRENRP